MAIRYEVGGDLDGHWQKAVEARADYSLQPLAGNFARARLRLSLHPRHSGQSMHYCCEFSARSTAGVNWHFRSFNEDALVALDDTIARVRRTVTRFRSAGT